MLNLFGKSVSVSEFLKRRLHDEAFDDPLTDYFEEEGEEGQEDGERAFEFEFALPARPAASTMPAASPASATPAANPRGSGSKRRRNEKREKATRDAILTDFSLAEDVEVTAPAWVTRESPNLPKQLFTKADLLEAHKLTYFPWNGRTVHLLLDRERYIVGVLAGHPNDKRWGQVHEDAFTKLQQAASTMSYSDKERSNRQGLFPTVAHGISFGGGQKEPRYLRHTSEKKTEALEQLVRDKSIQRICKFASCVRLWGVFAQDIQACEGNDGAASSQQGLHKEQKEAAST
ncbi:hypothetical protein M378DRAFT_19460 [Amanita muscaria Koide BX008]|uniref:Uncharacterized protein n=1 Tax=Amanita muscaria (strain Koide BX008) TaxID=946122 RepID=A0A0C2SIV6_AMAMK|nr:hypothetical protein M378DRAFT_19460 [Amanita muscaria Koide BX008]